MNDPFDLDLYGNYACDGICSFGEDDFELTVALRPVKANEVTDNG